MLYVAHSQSSVDLTTHEIVELLCGKAKALANTNRCKAECSSEFHDSPCVTHISRTHMLSTIHPAHTLWKLPFAYPTAGKASCKHTCHHSLQMENIQTVNPCHRDIELNKGQDTGYDDDYEECYLSGRLVSLSSILKFLLNSC